MNTGLNPRGFTGAFCGAVIEGGVGDTISQDRTGGMARMLVGGLIVGPLAGNSWSFLFQPRK